MLLKDLYYMTQIAGCGSLSRAARQLGITQSALSHAVSRLEREFSVPLLARQTGGVTLTPAGQAMVAEAQTILFHCRTMKETLAGYAQADRRHLKIGITTPPEKYVIPMLVKHYSCLLYTSSGGPYPPWPSSPAYTGRRTEPDGPAPVFRGGFPEPR